MAYELIYADINTTQCKVTGYTGEPVDVTIPTEYNGKQVTTIADNVFKGCKTIISVTIPEGVLSVGSYVFANCSNLEKISVPDSLTFFGTSSVSGCPKIAYNIKDNLKYIGNENNKYVCLCGFSDATNTEINVDNKCKIIVPYAFSGSNADTPGVVTKINIPVTGVEKYIGAYAFRYCSNLTSLKMGDNVISFGNGSFQGCKSLSSIVIPSSVTSIGTYAFKDCEKLNTIIVTSTNPPSASNDIFGPKTEFINSNKKKIYCDSKAKTKFESATNWKNYVGYYIEDDLRIRFILNSDAQKRYFASKEELKEAIENLGQNQTNIDLTDYVKKTDYATNDKFGLVKAGAGLYNNNGTLLTNPASDSEVTNFTSYYAPLCSSKIPLAVKAGITKNTFTLTDEEKASACEWLGTISKVSTTDTLQRIYAINIDGTQMLKKCSINPFGGALPIYDAGSIRVNAPTRDDHAASKSYVDTSLESYVKNTDIATNAKPGIICYHSNYGMQKIGSTLAPLIWDSYISARQNAFMTYALLDKIVKAGLTTNTLTLTDEEKAAAKAWLGINNSDVGGNTNLRMEVTELEDGSYSLTLKEV